MLIVLKQFLGVGLCLSWIGLVSAQSDVPAPMGPTSQPDLGEVVVTAARYEQSLESTMADVSVITRRDIEQSGYTQLSDVLVNLKGVQLSSNGGGQQTTSIFIRGQDSASTLVLIDGFRIGQLSGFGGASLQALPLESIERIEVLRGGGASLYGADAIGGVIQIITRRPSQNQFDSALTLGSDSTVGVDLQGTWVGERANLLLGGSYQHSDGYAVRSSQVAGGNNLNDPYRRNHGQLSYDYDLGNGYSIKLSGLQSVSQAEYDSGGRQADSTIYQDFYNARVQKKGARGERTTLRLGQTGEQLSFPGAFFFETHSTQTQMQVEHVENIQLGKLLIGAEWLSQDFDSTFAPAVNESEAESLLLGLTGQRGLWSYQLNVRQDFNDVFDDALTGSLALSRYLNLEHSVGVLLGTGFKRPRFNQISGFLNDAGLTQADVMNTNLEPEASQTAELFYNWEVPGRMARMGFYTLVVQDQIANELVGTRSSRSVNVPGDSESKGVTFQYSASQGAFKYGTYLEYLDSRLATGQRRPRVARFSGNLDVQWQQGSWLVKTDWRFASHRRDLVFGAPDRRLGGYGVVDAALQYQLCDKSSVALRFENVFGKDYENVADFNTPGQNVFLTYRQSF